MAMSLNNGSMDHRYSRAWLGPLASWARVMPSMLADLSNKEGEVTRTPKADDPQSITGFRL